MTYNFDPDRWYDNELAAIQAKHQRGEISGEELDRETQNLDRKHDAMWKRLDGSYQVPGQIPGTGGRPDSEPDA